LTSPTYLGSGIWFGISTDTDPTGVPAGSILIQYDVGVIKVYTGSAWVGISGTGGEANTASNVGTGEGVYKSKTGVNLAFRSLTATSSKIALANNTNDIGIDVTEANLTLGNLAGTLGISKGGTGQTTANPAFNALSPLTTLGDLLYYSTVNARLAGNTAAVKKFLNQTGNGTISAAPSWDALVDADLPTTQAGKTFTTPTLNGVVYGDVAITNSDSPYTALSTKKIIRADATSGNITINLPTAVGIAGFEYHIFRTDILSSTNIITIDANSTETIDGSLTHLLFSGEWIKLESDGANWRNVGRSEPTTQNYYMLKGSTADRCYIACQNLTTQACLISTTSPAANLLWALPIVIPRVTKFDVIRFRTTTASTAGNSRVGIYRDNGNMYPGVLYFDSGAVSTSGATGKKDTTITSSLQIMQPGLYWLAYEQDTATGQICIINVVSAVSNLTGSDFSNTNAPYYYTVAHTFGSLPDPYTAGGTMLNTNSQPGTPVPAIGIRAV